MWAAIQSWDINSRRNINYRSEMGRYTAWRIRSCLSQHGVPELSTLVLFSKGVCPHSV